MHFGLFKLLIFGKLVGTDLSRFSDVTERST